MHVHKPVPNGLIYSRIGLRWNPSKQVSATHEEERPPLRRQPDVLWFAGPAGLGGLLGIQGATTGVA